MLLNEKIEVLTESEVKRELNKIREQQELRKLQNSKTVLKYTAAATTSLGIIKVILALTPMVDNFALKSINYVKAAKNPYVLRMASKVNLSFLGLGIVNGSTIIISAYVFILLLFIPVYVKDLNEGKSIKAIALDTLLALSPIIFWGLF